MPTVLYIEDNLSNMELIQRVLARRGEVRLLTAMRGFEGLEMVREHRPDLILLDIHLPDLQGDEILQRLQEEEATARIPVIIISADATPGQIARLLNMGAREYLTKPLDVRKFLGVLDDALPRAGPVA